MHRCVEQNVSESAWQISDFGISVERLHNENNRYDSQRPISHLSARWSNGTETDKSHIHLRKAALRSAKLELPLIGSRMPVEIILQQTPDDLVLLDKRGQLATVRTTLAERESEL